MASNEIRVSPKYGLNPTMPICFWCGKERGDIAIMGRIGDGRKHEDIEAPRHMVIDYEPCDECKRNMALGFTVIEATTAPNSVTSVEIQRGVFPTGRFIVIKPEAAGRIFEGINLDIGKAFLESSVFMQVFCKGQNNTNEGYDI